MWRRTMLYLGLGPDDEYNDHEGDEAVSVSTGSGSTGGGASSASRGNGEPPDVVVSTVRPMPREREYVRDVEPESSVSTTPRARAGVVRPVAVTPSSAKPITVSPSSFNEAQSVADSFMAGTPVLVNLQGAERELSRRLVDFASGLCYGMRGQMERVKNQVYLLTPANVEISAEERRRLQDR